MTVSVRRATDPRNAAPRRSRRRRGDDILSPRLLLRRLVPALVLALAVTGATDAHAYCWTTTCDEVLACDGEPAPEGCEILGWRSRCVGFSVQEDGGGDLDADTVETLTELAFDAWRLADCGNGNPGFVVQNLGQVGCDKNQYNKDAGNANIVVVRAKRWPHPDTGHNIALTTTTFDPDTGDLLDADIELNADGYGLTVSDEAVDYDLLSVLTHEVGHFLGMGHADLPEATMYAIYEGGTTELRTLEPDDVAGICALYPPEDKPKKSCNPLPKHGFSPYCRDDQPEGSCSAAAEGSGAGWPDWLFVMGTVLLVRRRRLTS
jgi:hypothetical protein